MIYRHVARRWRSQRHQSSLVKNPVFQKHLFTQRNRLESFLGLPQDSYPNPLFGLDKNQLLDLSMKELQHLLKIPAKSASESDRFHQYIIEIFNENLIKNTRLAVLYLDLIKEPLVRETILQYLRKFYESDIIRSSILAFIENPDSEECHKSVLTNLHSVLKDSSDSPKVAAGVGLNYMRKLANTGRVKKNPLFLSIDYSKILLKHLPRDQWVHLFAAMVQANIRFKEYNHYKQIKTSLFSGSALDRFVARTGILDPKWHDTETSSFSGIQKQKMLIYFTISELALYTQHALRQKDVTLSNIYLELLVSKFESMKSPGHLQLILSVMLSHSMTFKGARECLKFLRYIKRSNLKLVPDTLLRILTVLRQDGFYDEALLLVNYLHTETLTDEERLNLVAEIMKVITGKFSSHPKVAVGYFVALFNDSDDSALRTLKDLMLLDLIYGPSIVNSSLSEIPRAEIHEDLKNSPLTHSNLREIYTVTLRSLPSEQSTSPVLIQKLYALYQCKLRESQVNDDQHNVFHDKNIDESIVTLFLDYLLRENPEGRAEMNLVHDGLKFETAKQIFNDFYAVHGTQKVIKGPYILGLLILSSLTKHQDLAFAISVFKKGRESGLPITFNQVYPFIMHHYSKGEMERAHMWFMLLMQSGAKAKSVAADIVFRIAREQNWPNTGTMYRNNVRSKMRTSRSELEKLNTDPLQSIINQSQPDEEVESFVASENLGHDLERILHELSMEK